MQTETLQQYEAKGGQLLTEAKSIQIMDASTREMATEFSSNTRKAIKIIENEFRPDIDKAHQLHKDLLARLKKLVAPFKAAQSIVDDEIRRDFWERERIRREEARIAQERADRERKAQEEALRKEAEVMIDEGNLEEAEALLDAEVVVNPIIPVAEVAKTSRSDAGSVTVRTDIQVELLSKMAVIKACWLKELPETILDVNVGNAKRYAKSLGKTTGMPGFKITETAVISGRTR